MAWLPIEFDTPEKPEIQLMAEALKRETEEILGRVILVWRWAQEQTPDGRITPGSLSMVDRQARLKGFGAAMQAVKWLALEGDTLVFSRWDLHNSDNAKERKLNARRAAKSRKKRDAIVTPVTPESRPDRDKPAPTEQNRTELVDGGGGDSSLDEGKAQRTAWFKRRPDWVPEGKPWIDRKACERLAGLSLTSDVVAEIYREAKDKRNTLENPAGYIITNLEKAGGAA